MRSFAGTAPLTPPSTSRSTASPGRETEPSRAYADAGATWWCEAIFGLRGSREELLARAAASPAMTARPVPSHTPFASLSPTSSPSPSPTVPPSPVPTGTSNIIIFGVDTPDPAATTPAPTPTPVPLVVAPAVTVRTFATMNSLITWSPVRDEFVYANCTMPRDAPIGTLVPYSFQPERYVAAMSLPGRPPVSMPELFPLLERTVWPGTSYQSLFASWWNEAANEMAMVTWSDGVWTTAPETTIRIWDIDGGDIRSFFPGGHSVSLNAAGTVAAVESSEAIRLSPDGRSTGLQPAATGDARPYVHLVETGTGRVLRSIPSSFFMPRNEYIWMATGPLWHPMADRFIYRSRDGELHLFDVDTGRSHPLTRSGGHRLTDLAWSPSGRYLSAQLCEGRECQTLLLDLAP